MEMPKIQQPIVQQILECFYLSSKQAIFSHLILFCLISKKIYNFFIMWWLVLFLNFFVVAFNKFDFFFLISLSKYFLHIKFVGRFTLYSFIFPSFKYDLIFQKNKLARYFNKFFNDVNDDFYFPGFIFIFEVN